MEALPSISIVFLIKCSVSVSREPVPFTNINLSLYGVIRSTTNIILALVSDESSVICIINVDCMCVKL